MPVLHDVQRDLKLFFELPHDYLSRLREQDRDRPLSLLLLVVLEYGRRPRRAPERDQCLGLNAPQVMEYFRLPVVHEDFDLFLPISNLCRSLRTPVNASKTVQAHRSCSSSVGESCRTSNATASSAENVTSSSFQTKT